MKPRANRKKSRGGTRKKKSPRLSIVVTGATNELAALISQAARRALSAEAKDAGRLEIAVVGDTEMRRQHRQWMGDPTVTDVLTFDMRDDDDDTEIDGQILVGGRVARRRAKKLGIEWQRELLLYVVHGCLHLCGYDDYRPSDSKRMHRREDEILVDIGLGPVYSRPKGVQSSKSKKGK